MEEKPSYIIYETVGEELISCSYSYKTEIEAVSKCKERVRQYGRTYYVLKSIKKIQAQDITVTSLED